MGEKGRLLTIRNERNEQESYILLGREHKTVDGGHLIVLGADLMESEEQNLESAIHEVLDKGGIPIISHPLVTGRFFRDMGNKGVKQLERIEERYGNRVAYDWNAYCIAWLRKTMGFGVGLFYGDVNARLEKYVNGRIVPTSDTHARNKKLLDGIGTASVTFDRKNLNFSSEDALYRSIKWSIEDGNYGLRKEYVSFTGHWLPAFGWPMVKSVVKKAVRRK